MRNKICIMGLGYVGLSLAHAFSLKYKVIGFDISAWRIDELKNGYDRTLEFKNKNQIVYDIKSILKTSDGRL